MTNRDEYPSAEVLKALVECVAAITGDPQYANGGMLEYRRRVFLAALKASREKEKPSDDERIIQCRNCGQKRRMFHDKCWCGERSWKEVPAQPAPSPVKQRTCEEILYYAEQYGRRESTHDKDKLTVIDACMREALAAHRSEVAECKVDLMTAIQQRDELRSRIALVNDVLNDNHPIMLILEGRA